VIIDASDFISENNKSILNAEMIQEHLTRQDVKQARKLFVSLMSRSNNIISNNKPPPPPPATLADFVENKEEIILKNNYSDRDNDDNIADSGVLYEVKETAEMIGADIQCSESICEHINIYSSGMKVLCNYGNHGQWCPGTVTSSKAGGVYDIQYDDGDVEDSREEDAIMNIPTESDSIIHFEYKVGDSVLGNFESKGIWFEGVLKAVNGEAPVISFDVEYNDGDVECQIAADCVIIPHRKLSIRLL
jgi:hypothetical protein